MHPSLKEAREALTYSIDEMSNFYYGSKEEKERKIKMHKIFSEDPILKNDPADNDLDRMELFKLYCKKTKRFQEVLNYMEMEPEFWPHFPQQMIGGMSKYMFLPTIQTLGTEEQVRNLQERTLQMEIIGCYAQTEMGHGSDVQGLETTATFDKEKDQFILHSPKIASAKWWPGDLGKVANYAVVHAQLIIEGKKYGIQTFVVQIRDIKTHLPLKGCEMGDIGPKLGFNTKDNGYLKFNQYRIPRDGMLQKYAKVSKTGEFTRTGNERVGYSTMMLVRTIISTACSEYLAHASTIATRYALVRTQFQGDNGKEMQILDYQTQMEKVIPQIAVTYAMRSGAKKLKKMYRQHIAQVEQNDFSLMQDLHSALSGTKAFWTWDAANGIESLRMSCGGHGFSDYSAFPALYREFSPNCTHEGENTVMALQCARYLIKCLGALKKKEPLLESVSYLTFLNALLAGHSCTAKGENDFNLETIEKVAQANAAFLAYSAAQKLIKAQKQGLSEKAALNSKAGIELVEAARAHTTYFTYKAFMTEVASFSDTQVKSVLSKLCLLYGIHKLLQFPLGLVESKYISGEQITLMKSKKEELLRELRKDVIGLVDAFNYPDNTLKSALGGYDGNVYETLWDWVKNKNYFNKKEIIDGYETISQLKDVKRPAPLFPKL
jgi:acyl-CoA oxidase